jgi:arylsulfatase A-like enzyme
MTSTSSVAGSKKPNFLVIMGDDFGFSDIGAFGGEVPLLIWTHLRKMVKF